MITHYKEDDTPSYIVYEHEIKIERALESYDIKYLKELLKRCRIKKPKIKVRRKKRETLITISTPYLSYFSDACFQIGYLNSQLDEGR